MSYFYEYDEEDTVVGIVAGVLFNGHLLDEDDATELFMESFHVSGGNNDDDGVDVAEPPVRKPLWRDWADCSRHRGSNIRWKAVGAAHEVVQPEGFDPGVWHRLRSQMVRKPKAVK